MSQNKSQHITEKVEMKFYGENNKKTYALGSGSSNSSNSSIKPLMGRLSHKELYTTVHRLLLCVQCSNRTVEF